MNNPPIEAARIYRDAKGQLKAWDVVLVYCRPKKVVDALEDVRTGVTTFVLREDVAALMDKIQPSD